MGRVMKCRDSKCQINKKFPRIFNFHVICVPCCDTQSKKLWTWILQDQWAWTSMNPGITRSPSALKIREFGGMTTEVMGPMAVMTSPCHCHCQMTKQYLNDNSSFVNQFLAFHCQNSAVVNDNWLLGYIRSYGNRQVLNFHDIFRDTVGNTFGNFTHRHRK